MLQAKRLVIGICLILICGNSAFAEDKYQGKINEGDNCPNFTYSTPNGEVKQFEALRGKNVLLLFFATWCPPCREEIAYLEKHVYPHVKNHSNIEVLVFGREHTQEQVNAFKQKNKYQLPMYADPSRAIFSLFADGYIPRCYIITPEGKVAYQSVGFDQKKASTILPTLLKN